MRIAHRLVVLFLLFLLSLGLTLLPVISTIAPSIAQTTPSPAQLFQQGTTLYQTGQFPAAATAFQQAATAYREQGNPLKQAATLGNLALAYQQSGEWQLAQQALTESFAILKPLPQSPPTLTVLASVLEIQAGLYLAMGQPEKALETWTTATDRYTQLHDTTGVTRSTINQAKALQASGFYRRALNLLQQLSQQLTAQPDSALKMSALRSLGDTLQLTGDLENARQVLEQSLAIANQLGLHEDISAINLSLGNTARAQKDIPAAVSFYQQAITWSNQPLSTAQAQINYLSLLTDLNQVTNAITLIDQIQLTILPPNRDGIFAQIHYAQTVIQLMGKFKANPVVQSATPRFRQSLVTLLTYTIQQAESLQDQSSQAYALGTLGHLYEQMGQWSEAQQTTEQALHRIHNHPAPEIAYRYLWQLGRLFVAQGHLPQAKAAYEGAIANLQSLRRDLLAANRDAQFNFRDGVEPIYREAVALLFELEKTAPNQANLNQARELIEALQLAELDNFFRAACIDFKSISLDQAAEVDTTAAVIYPIILDQQLQVIAKIPNQPLINYATNQPRAAITVELQKLRVQLVKQHTVSETKQLGKTVYEWLIQPIAAQLQQAGVKTLVFVLDGEFRNVPMAVLYDGKRYLIEQYAVAVNLSLQLPESRPLTMNAIVAGLSEPPPVFRQRYNFGSLPEVKTELTLIEQAGIKTQPLVDQAFNKQNLQQAVRSQPSSIVHLATHGSFSSKAADTFILTADGAMNVDEFETLLRDRGQTRAKSIELLVLSACQTAAGDNRATLGLAGVAFRAGARSTLASLWQVDDRATALLMGEFYRALMQPNVTKAEALRRAQVSFISGQFNEASSRYLRPLYWSAYTLIGNWL